MSPWPLPARAVALCALAGLAAPLSAGAAWTDVTDLTGSAALPSRGQFGFVCTPNGDLYVAGGAGRLVVDGHRQFTLFGDVWRWQPGGVFTDLTVPTAFPMPPTIEAHLAADAHGRVYEFGGVQNAIDGTYSNRLYRFTPSRGAWEDVTPALSPAAREDHGFTGDTQRNVLWLFGGVTQDATQLNDLWMYDVTQGAWHAVTPTTAAAPHPRELYDLAWDGHDALYLFGGYADDTGYLHDFWRFDIPQSRWTDLTAASGAEQIAPRSYNGLAVDGNGIVWMAGGYAAPAVLGGMWRYDPRDGRWADVSDGAADLMPRVTYEMVYRPQDGSLYLFGGTTIDPARPGTLLTLADMWRDDLHPRIVATTPPDGDTLRVGGDSTLVFTLRAESESGRAPAIAWDVDGAPRLCAGDTLRWRAYADGVYRIVARASDGPLADSVVWIVDARAVSLRAPRRGADLLVAAGPSPGTTRVRLRQTVAGPVDLRVLDVDGRLAWRITAPPDGPGARWIDLDLRAVPRGVYVVEARDATSVRRARLLHLP